MIVDMNRITIAGLMKEKSNILSLLMQCGFVQVDDAGEFLEEEEMQGLAKTVPQEEQIAAWEQSRYQIQRALELLQKYGGGKKALFAEKQPYQPLPQKEENEQSQLVEQILKAQADIEKQRAERTSLSIHLEQMRPWKGLDIPFDLQETKRTRILLGTVPAKVQVNEISQKLDEEGIPSFLQVISEDKTNQYMAAVCLKEDWTRLSEQLQPYGFSPVQFEKETNTPAKAMAQCEAAIANTILREEKLIQAIAVLAKQEEVLKNYYDSVTNRIEKQKAAGKLLQTKTSFILTGFLPSGKAKLLMQDLAPFDCVVETARANPEEDYPVLLENGKFVTPFQSITNMYSPPSPRDIDPNPVLAVFYTLFFGMMLSDAGYGIIIALVCGFMVHKMKWKKGEGNLVKLIGFGGVSTFVWGLVFGSFFGDLIPIKALINPLTDVMLLMGLSFLLGIVHIFVGLGLKAYGLIKNGKIADAICDVLFWYVFITGVCLLIVPVVAGDIGIFSTIGVYLAIGGAIGLILTQGRAQDNLFMKLFKGVSSLYGITGYFSDILSYSRLMALCLTTGVISQVINLLGAIAGPVPAFIIGLIGHTVNLLINALGAYVHTSRLQYVEFFSKFYEGGGRPFTPLQYKNQYTKTDR